MGNEEARSRFSFKTCEKSMICLKKKKVRGMKRRGSKMNSWKEDDRGEKRGDFRAIFGRVVKQQSLPLLRPAHATHKSKRRKKSSSSGAAPKRALEKLGSGKK